MTKIKVMDLEMSKTFQFYYSADKSMLEHSSAHKSFRPLLVSFFCIALTSVSTASDEPADHEHRVVGLFQKDREDDLRETLERVPGVKLVSANYQTGMATLRYDPRQVLPQSKFYKQVNQKLDQLVRQASRGTFQVRLPSEIDRKTLAKEEIGVVGLDCKGCSYGAYLAVYNLEGVENATANFKNGKVIVWFDEKKINRAMLEDALTSKMVKLTPAEPTQP